LHCLEASRKRGICTNAFKISTRTALGPQAAGWGEDGAALSGMYCKETIQRDGEASSKNQFLEEKVHEGWGAMY